MYIKSIVFSILTLISSITAYAQDHQHTDHLTILLEHYIKAKEALTDDSFNTARSHLSEFRNEVVENNKMNNHEEHSEMHANHHKSMVDVVEQVKLASDIKELRSVFEDITDILVKALENQGYSEEMLYLQYCPMAVSNEGAHWISSKKKIINPYMGKQMPGCGKMERVINSES